MSLQRILKVRPFGFRVNINIFALIFTYVKDKYYLRMYFNVDEYIFVLNEIKCLM